MFATAPATTRPARSSRGKEMMRTTRPPVVDGLSLALQAASSDTSTSTTARIQASYAIVTDFFNGLLDQQHACASFICRCFILGSLSKTTPFGAGTAGTHLVHRVAGAAHITSSRV